MKFFFSTLLVVVAAITVHSQSESVKRFVFDDAKSLLELQKKLESQKNTRTNSQKIIRGNANPKIKVAAQILLGTTNEAIDKNESALRELLTYYFKTPEEISSFNANYKFNLPIYNDIAAGGKKTVVDYGYKQIRTDNQEITGAGEAALINAMGTFLADRFKKEINVAFLNKFKKQLDSLPYLGDFFPLSKKVMNQSDPYNYPVFIGTLRQAFEQDLADLKINLPQIMVNSKDGTIKVNAVLHSVGYLLKAKSFSDIRTSLNTIGTDSQIKAALPEFHKQAGLLAFSYNAVTRLDGDKAGFISEDDMKEFLDPEFAHNYMALLVRQNEAYLLEVYTTVSKIAEYWDFDQINNRILMLKDIASYFAALKNEIDTLIAADRSGPKTAKSFSILLNGLESLLARAKEEGWFHMSSKFDQFKEAVAYAKKLNNAVIYVESKQYGLAVTEITTVTLDFGNTRLTPEQKVMIKKYSGFIADMLSAKSKEELLAALENSANPVGSYRVKRNSTFNISLNAYAGVFWGHDVHNSAVFGVTAPVGLYAGLGNLGKKRPVLGKDNGTSWGIFLPIIDVGSVASFRLQDSETELADISWDNVFSPGAYLTHGFRNCPVSINLGGQMGPALKEVLPDGSSVIGDKTWYWRAAVVIDIPLFDLHVKQKEYMVPEVQPAEITSENIKGYTVNLKCSAAPGVLPTKLYSNDEILGLNAMFKNSLLFDWKEKKNGEDRVHVMYEILKKKGYDCGKIWVFEELSNNKKADELNSKKDFHVAIFFRNVEVGKLIVLDPSFYNDTVGDSDEWIKNISNKDNSSYVLTPGGYYKPKKDTFSCNDADWSSVNYPLNSKEKDQIKNRKKIMEHLSGTKWYCIFGRKKKITSANAEYQKLMGSELIYQKLE